MAHEPERDSGECILKTVFIFRSKLIKWTINLFGISSAIPLLLSSFFVRLLMPNVQLPQAHANNGRTLHVAENHSYTSLIPICIRCRSHLRPANKNRPAKPRIFATVVYVWLRFVLIDVRHRTMDSSGVRLLLLFLLNVTVLHGTLGARNAYDRKRAALLID